MVKAGVRHDYRRYLFVEHHHAPEWLAPMQHQTRFTLEKERELVAKIKQAFR